MNFASPTGFNGVYVHSSHISTLEPKQNRANEVDRRSDIKDKTRSARKLGIENEPDVGRKLDTEVTHETVSELGNDSDKGIVGEGDNYVDVQNNIESESENDLDQLIELRGEVFALNVRTSRSEDVAYEHMDSYPDYKQSSEFPEPVSSVNCFDQQMSQVSGLSSDVPGTSIHDIHDSSKEETVVTVPSSSAPATSMCDSLDSLRINGIQESQESQAENRPVNTWTNGNLLGLEPSKPPVFAIPKFARLDIETQDCVDDPADAQLQSLICANASEPIASKPGLSKAVAHQGNTEIFSGALGLSHRLLSFLAKEPITNSAKHLTACISEAVQQNKPYDLEPQQLMLEYPFERLTLSPPLEHMKLSFNPAAASSQLKLKFPDRAQSLSNHTLPSFQLVPEHIVSLNGVESEADTFCRSSPSMSDDDYLCYAQSESGSGDWKDHGVSSDGEGRGTFKALQGTTHVQNGEEHSLSNGLLDLPSLDTLMIKPQTKMQDDSDVSENHLNTEISMEPSPPPLPPFQWRVPQTPSESFKDKQQRLQDALGHSFCRKGSISTDTEQVDQVHKDRPDYVPDTPNPFIMLQVHQKLQDNNQNANGKHTAKGDFLHQIQTKRCNLRRTVTTMPSSTNIPDAHIKAVLEKALSIRQAVGTDDGDETDTWSDA